MSRKTEYLELHLPDENEFYDVEKDQNQNFEKIDRKLKEINTDKEPIITKKTGFNLDKTDEYNIDNTNLLGSAKALKKLYDELNRKIEALDICPYKVGDVYVTTNTQEPSTIWGGTKWQRLTGRFLKGTETNEATGQLGGSNTKTLTVANLPSHNHSAWSDTQGWHTHTQDEHSHGRGSMDITGKFGGLIVNGLKEGAFSKYNTWGVRGDSGGMSTSGNRGYGGDNFDFYASRTWSGTTTGARPNIQGNGSHNHNIGIGNTGNGQAFDINPMYITVNMWKRIG